MDIHLPFGGSSGHRHGHSPPSLYQPWTICPCVSIGQGHQQGPCWQHSQQDLTWIQVVAAQSTDIQKASGGNKNHGYEHRPGYNKTMEQHMAAAWTMGLNIASGGYTSHSHQHPYLPRQQSPRTSPRLQSASQIAYVHMDLGSKKQQLSAEF